LQQVFVKTARKCAEERLNAFTREHEKRGSLTKENANKAKTRTICPRIFFALFVFFRGDFSFFLGILNFPQDFLPAAFPILSPKKCLFRLFFVVFANAFA